MPPIDPWHIFSTSLGDMPKPYTAFITLLDMLMYFYVSFMVGRARRKFKVPAPSTDGPEGFQRYFRVQMNTLEHLMFHLPLLWMVAFGVSDVLAASLGSIWCLGRVLYARGYYNKPKRRFKGFIISMTMNGLLFIAAMIGVISAL